MLFAALFPVAFCRRKLIRCYCGAMTCCPGEPVGRIGLIGGARDNTFWRDAALPHCSRLSAGDDISCLDSSRLSSSRKTPVNQSNLEISCWLDYFTSKFGRSDVLGVESWAESSGRGQGQI